MGKDWKNFEVRDRKSLDCLEGTIGRNTDIIDDSGMGSEGSEKKWQTVHPTSQETYTASEKNVSRNIKSAFG